MTDHGIFIDDKKFEELVQICDEKIPDFGVAKSLGGELLRAYCFAENNTFPNLKKNKGEDTAKALSFILKHTNKDERIIDCLKALLEKDFSNEREKDGKVYYLTIAQSCELNYIQSLLFAKFGIALHDYLKENENLLVDQENRISDCFEAYNEIDEIFK